MAVHGRVCEQSQGQASEQQELVLKLWRMPQRRVSQRTLAPMAGCCLGSLSSSFRGPPFSQKALRSSRGNPHEQQSPSDRSSPCSSFLLKIRLLK